MNLTKAPRNKTKGKNLKRQQEKTKQSEGKTGRPQLRGEGWDPATTDPPAILSIDIVRLFFNLIHFPKFSVMEERHSSNHTNLLIQMSDFLHILRENLVPPDKCTLTILFIDVYL